MKVYIINIHVLDTPELGLEFIKQEFEEILKKYSSTLNIQEADLEVSGPFYKKLIRNYLKDRDGINCCWCGEPMEFEGDRDSPNQVTIEHVLRKSEGGTNDLKNLKLAHKSCNCERHIGTDGIKRYDRTVENVLIQIIGNELSGCTSLHEIGVKARVKAFQVASVLREKNWQIQYKLGQMKQTVKFSLKDRDIEFVVHERI